MPHISVHHSWRKRQRFLQGKCQRNLYVKSQCNLHRKRNLAENLSQ